MSDRQSRSTVPHRHSFGARLRAIRLMRGLSQEDLAELAGIHRTYVSSVERGERNIGLDNVIALATALEVDPSELFDWNGTAANDPRTSR